MNRIALAAAILAGPLVVPVSAQSWVPDLSQTMFNADEWVRERNQALNRIFRPRDPRGYGLPGQNRDCVPITFGAEDGPASKKFTLQSYEETPSCFRDWQVDLGREARAVLPGFPSERQLNPFPESRGSCGGPRRNVEVRVSLSERLPLLPWERDSFLVCLDDRSLTVHPVRTAYDYTHNIQGSSIVLTPGNKIASAPDPNGLGADLSNDLTLTFRDRWSAFYAGETIVLRITLREKTRGWIDSTLFATSLSLPTADRYHVSLLDRAADFTFAPKAGGAYYVEYSFQRIGRVSTDETSKTAQTEPVVFLSK